MDTMPLISRVISSQLAQSRPTPSVFVALGDSFTAGTGSDDGDAWADRLASGIRGNGGGELAYRNLARDGATSGEVLEQVRSATEMEPDLVTLVCGANDVLSSTRPDTDAYATRLGSMFEQLRAANPGVKIVTATAPEGWHFLPLGRRTQARVERGVRELNEATREVARSHGVPCLEVAGHAGLSDRENFCEDGLHPSSIGHAHAAEAFAALLHEQFGIETEMEVGR